MKYITVFVTTCLLTLGCMLPLMAQNNTSAGVVVPRLVNYSGKALDAQGRPLSGIAGVTFSIYKDEYDGAPLWLETQNVQADSKGNYAIQLGATKPEGLPLELFTSGEARWLGVRVNSGEEQPRVLLLSVPYALKAADAQTLGGLPASAFMLAGTVAAGTSSSSVAISAPETVAPAVSGTGATDFLPLWINTTGALGNSVLFQSGTGTTAKIGINTIAPAVTLDVNGGENVRGILTSTALGTATAASGKNSEPHDFVASVFNSSTASAVAQKFQWQAEPVSNNTASASGAMSLLHGSGTAAPVETGLKINSKGQLSFATGQTFPSTVGSVKSVGLSAPSADFTVSGAPVTGSGTLALNWKVAPTSAATANAIVKRDATGSFTAASITGDLGVSGYSAVVGIYGQSNGTESGDNGVEGVTFAGPGSGVAGFNDSGVAGGIGVYGQADTAFYGNGATTGVFGHGGSFGFATDGNVQQARTAGGWVKAMVYVNAFQTPYNITACYNSTLAGAAASTPPCGFTLTEDDIGIFDINFGFQVSDRFLIGSLAQSSAPSSIYVAPGGLSNNSATALCSSGNGEANCRYYVMVF
jgi:hypothetical protein